MNIRRRYIQKNFSTATVYQKQSNKKLVNKTCFLLSIHINIFHSSFKLHRMTKGKVERKCTSVSQCYLYLRCFLRQ